MVITKAIALEWPWSSRDENCLLRLSDDSWEGMVLHDLKKKVFLGASGMGRTNQISFTDIVRWPAYLSWRLGLESELTISNLPFPLMTSCVAVLLP